MWRLRRKTERGWHDGFHIHTGVEAKGLCDLLNNLERELAESNKLKRKLAEAREQRAAATEELIHLKQWQRITGVSDLIRELDEWKALATQYSVEREHNAMQALAYEAERDEWKAKYIQQNNDLGCEQMDPNGTIWDHAATLQRERDELRRWTSVNGVIELQRERDDARGQRDRLAGVLQSIRDDYGGQVADPDCDCWECEFLIPIDEALESITPNKP
jgi:hypothetical protein